MELRITPYSLPEAVLFNYDELKAELTQKCEFYNTLVYTEEQIKTAKSERANLSKLKKALNDERIRLEKEYMKPFNEFKGKINELITIVDTPIGIIDRQIKETEEKRKAEKHDEIEGIFHDAGAPDWLILPMIWDEKWLNASVSLKKITEDITEKVTSIKNNLDTLAALPEFGFEASEIYKQTLDMNKAVAEAQKMADIARRKKEAAEIEAAVKAAKEKEQKEQLPEIEEEPVLVEAPVVEDQIPGQMSLSDLESQHLARQWVSFKAFLSVDEALALKDFFVSNGIEFTKA